MNLADIISGKQGHPDPLAKLLDDEMLLGETDKIVVKFEEAMDTVADLAQNKTVQALLNSAGDLIPGDGGEGTDVGAVVMNHIENLDIEAAVQVGIRRGRSAIGREGTNCAYCVDSQGLRDGILVDEERAFPNRP